MWANLIWSLITALSALAGFSIGAWIIGPPLARWYLRRM